MMMPCSCWPLRPWRCRVCPCCRLYVSCRRGQEGAVGQATATPAVPLPSHVAVAAGLLEVLAGSCRCCCCRCLCGSGCYSSDGRQCGSPCSRCHADSDTEALSSILTNRCRGCGASCSALSRPLPYRSKGRFGRFADCPGPLRQQQQHQAGPGRQLQTDGRHPIYMPSGSTWRALQKSTITCASMSSGAAQMPIF